MNVTLFLIKLKNALVFFFSYETRINQFNLPLKCTYIHKASQELFSKKTLKRRTRKHLHKVLAGNLKKGYSGGTSGLRIGFRLMA